jgi:hypothetical protein
MKHLKVAGLCLVSMLMMSMALAGTASAQPLWLACLEGTSGTTPTKYTEKQCRTAASGNDGTWQWNEVSGTDKVMILAMTITLTDEKVPIFGKSTIQCGHGTGAGVIGPKSKGRITEAKVTNPKTECERVSGPCKAGEIEKVEGANLPWQTEMFETEGKFQTHIEATTAGKEPGWSVTCNAEVTGKGTVDTCTQESEKPETVTLENKASLNSAGEIELLVLGTFLKKHKADCSKGGKEAGVVEGQIAILLTTGGGLRIDPA